MMLREEQRRDILIFDEIGMSTSGTYTGVVWG